MHKPPNQGHRQGSECSRIAGSKVVDQQSLWAGLGADFVELFGNFIQGLIPGYALKFPLTALADTLEGVLQTSGVVQIGEPGINNAFLANAAELFPSRWRDSLLGINDSPILHARGEHTKLMATGPHAVVIGNFFFYHSEHSFSRNLDGFHNVRVPRFFI